MQQFLILCQQTALYFFDDSEIRYYSREDGSLHYGEITSLMAAEITIGNLHMNYRDFLDLLRNPGSGSGGGQSVR